MSRGTNVRLVAGVIACAVVVGATIGGPSAGAAKVKRCQGLRADIVGTKGDDVLKGTGKPDVFFAKAGEDSVYGFDGDDVVCGGAGVDTVRGGSDDDLLYGEADGDGLLGGSGDDELNGGSTGSGQDFCDGGTGTDAGVFCEVSANIP
jgi:Ca2+-binding RTX toxin-like protein